MSNLSEWGGGVRAGPEHEAKHRLTEWLKEHGASVWWEEQNAWAHPVFSMETSGESVGRPDLIIKIDGETLVAEFKVPDGGGEVYQAQAQLFFYWFEYNQRDHRFMIDGEAVDVDAFVTATKNSRAGHLFPEYDEPEPVVYSEMSEGQQIAVDSGALPRAEYPMTEQHIRALWRLSNRADKTLDGFEDTPLLGSLLSDALIPRNSAPGRPAVLWNAGGQDWEVFNDG